jgi:hypothetical protein
MLLQSLVQAAMRCHCCRLLYCWVLLPHAYVAINHAQGQPESAAESTCLRVYAEVRDMAVTLLADQ